MNESVPDLKVLLVDDDPALLEALEEALSLKLGTLTVQACDAAAGALEALEKLDYDAVISDIKMPGMDGLELITRIKERWPDIPTLLITGHGETDLAIGALRAGAYDLIQKPIDRDYVAAAVVRAAEIRRLRQEVKDNQAELESYTQDLERRVAERTAELQRANQEKDEFLALVSHELRTPTTTIYGVARLLTTRNSELDDAAKQELIGNLGDEANRLFELIENLIAIGRTNLLIDVSIQETDLGSQIEAIVANYASRAPRRRIETSLDPSGRFVRGEATYIRQILDNLLSNANKYSPEGCVIYVTTESTPEEVRVSVADEGPGVTSDELHSIFDAFYRSQTTSGAVSGKGLGLAVCKRLVEAQGGRIWAENRLEGGLQVTFALARAPGQVTFTLAQEPRMVTSAGSGAGQSGLDR